MSLTIEKERATRLAEESTVMVVHLEGQSRALQTCLEVALAWASLTEEKATIVVALMEATKSDATKAVPRYNASEEFK